MNPLRNALRLVAMYVIAAATIAHALTAEAGEKPRPVDHPAWKQECGSCHIAFPPQLLSAASWRAVMGGLDRHFGSDASVEPAVRADVLAFLEKNAGRRDTSAMGVPLVRISETEWFRKEHRREIAAGTPKRADVRSIANCGACHTQAEKFDYSGRSLQVPGGRSR
jgi:hypothetical protein